MGMMVDPDEETKQAETHFLRGKNRSMRIYATPSYTVRGDEDGWVGIREKKHVLYLASFGRSRPNLLVINNKFFEKHAHTLPSLAPMPTACSLSFKIRCSTQEPHAVAGQSIAGGESELVGSNSLYMK
jgi:hypothetical protein